MTEVTFPKTGKFTITTGLAGAPVLQVVLTATDGDTVTGHGVFTQAVNPPVSIPTLFTGCIHTTGFGKAEQFFVLKGSSPSHLMGAKYVSSLVIGLDGIWADSGTSTYKIFTDTPKVEAYDNVPTTVEWYVLK